MTARLAGPQGGVLAAAPPRAVAELELVRLALASRRAVEDELPASAPATVRVR